MCQYQVRKPPPPPPENDENFDFSLYPEKGGWPEYLRKHCQHLLGTPDMQESFEYEGGEIPSPFGELVSFPGNTTHRGVKLPDVLSSFFPSSFLPSSLLPSSFLPFSLPSLLFPLPSLFLLSSLFPLLYLSPSLSPFPLDLPPNDEQELDEDRVCLFWFSYDPLLVYFISSFLFIFLLLLIVS
jgi:hypothetical protein